MNVGSVILMWLPFAWNLMTRSLLNSGPSRSSVPFCSKGQVFTFLRLVNLTDCEPILLLHWCPYLLRFPSSFFGFCFVYLGMWELLLLLFWYSVLLSSLAALRMFPCLSQTVTFVVYLIFCSGPSNSTAALCLWVPLSWKPLIPRPWFCIIGSDLQLGFCLNSWFREIGFLRF